MVLYTLREEKVAAPNLGTVEALVADGACGYIGGPAFKDIATILEPRSPNPCFLIPKPMGISGILALIELLKDWRKKNGVGSEWDAFGTMGGRDDEGN